MARGKEQPTIETQIAEQRAANQLAKVILGGEPEPEVPEAAGTGWMKDEQRSVELVVPRVFADSDLAEIDSWDTALSFVEGAFGDMLNGAEVIGSGFRMADDDTMGRMVGSPLMLMQWVFYPGDFGKDFVAVNTVQRYDNGSINKWVITDGGSGICDQLKEYTAKTARTGGLFFPKGLRVSSFYFDPETQKALTKQQEREYLTSGKKMTPAKTFYLDTSA